MEDCPHKLDNKSELPKEPKTHGLLGNAVRGFLVLTVAGGAVEGCAHTKEKKPDIREAAPRGTDLEETRKFLEATLCVNLPQGSDDAKCKEIAKEGAESMIKYYLMQARESVMHKREQRNDYFKAIYYYNKTLELMVADHPERKQAEQELKSIKDKLVSTEKEYNEKYNQLKKLLKKPNYEEGEWESIQRTFEWLRVSRIIIQIEDKALTFLAIDYFNKFFKEKNYERATKSARMARELDLKKTPFSNVSQLSDEDGKLFAIAYHLYEVEKEEKIKALTEEMQNAFKEKRYNQAKKLANEIKKLDPKNPAIAKVNGKVKKRRWSSIKRNSVHLDEALGEIQDFLKEIEQKFKQGKKFEAITELEEAIPVFEGNQHQSLLIRQQKKWGKTRKKLIDEYLKKANDLYVAEDPEALDVYKALLKLNPPNKIRKHAKDRIETLKNIIGE